MTDRLKTMACLIGFLSILFLQTVSCERPVITGQLSLDSSWQRRIFLSYIPSLEERFTMSSDMIVAESEIDSAGHFNIAIDHLPEEPHLFRIHLVKKNDSRSTLIIGGRDENHSFLVASAQDSFGIYNKAGGTVFETLRVENAQTNVDLQKVLSLVHRADSIARNSTSGKRQMVKDRLNQDLLNEAMASDNVLVALFALEQIKKSWLVSQQNFIQSFLDKWDGHNSSYWLTFAERHKKPKSSNALDWMVLLVIPFGFLLWFVFRKKSDRKNLAALTLQERKVFQLLQTGYSNQQIADELHIGLSTVKSHVSNIYSKLNIASRKEVVDIKL